MLFVSVVSVAEIEGGIAKLRREGATRKSGDLTAWLETVLIFMVTASSPSIRPRHGSPASCQSGHAVKGRHGGSAISSLQRPRGTTA
jgi:hypothetical protein